jgi:hypothetical protein
MSKFNLQPDMDTAYRDDKASMPGYVLVLSVMEDICTSTCCLASCHTGTLEPWNPKGTRAYSTQEVLPFVCSTPGLYTYIPRYMPYRQADGYLTQVAWMS